MSNSGDKRMIANTGYEVKKAIHIGDSEVLFAENMKEPECNYYLVANYVDNGLIGEYSRCMASSDYLEIMKEFITRLDRQLDKVTTEISVVDYHAGIITAEQCYPNDYSQSIDGKVVAIKAEVLRPEYRRGDNQLVLVNGGNGAHGNTRGNAVFCNHLNDGRHTRFERYEVQGEIKELPEWAMERLVVIRAEQEIERQNNVEPTQQENVAGYTITERIKVGANTFVLGENPNAVSPYVTWQHIEGRAGYFWGHYFSNRDKALVDLSARVAKERNNISPDKARKTKTRDDAR